MKPICIAAISLTMCCIAETAAASISVADGDSFRMNGERYRLQNVDAPELHQMCKDAAGREWACGRRARDELRRLLTQGPVSCQAIMRDRFNRKVAICTAGGRDVGETMVRQGWATAYKGRGLSSQYLGAEAEARAARRGMWVGSFEPPRQWREGHPREEESGEILSRQAQDWLRDKAAAVSAWFRALWVKP